VREVLLFEKNDIEYYEHGESITLCEPSRKEIEGRKKIANSKIEILEYSVRLGNCLIRILGGKKYLRFASRSGFGKKTWNELSILLEETGLISRGEISDYDSLYRQYRKDLWILCDCGVVIKRGDSPIINYRVGFWQPEFIKPAVYAEGTCDSCR
jgi:hypothetical protein